MSGLQITPIPCLRDNYAYLLVCDATGEAAVVNPSAAEPVLAALDAVGVEPTTILNTHHHWDHTGGNKGLLARWPGLAVVGHVSDKGRVPGQTVFVEDGDPVAVGAAKGTVRHIPGHTLGAVAFCFDGEVFTGDTLFQGGCGRLFEGTPQMMYTSLVEVLAGTLPAETRVWCGHEYTVSNLRFALSCEPDNEAVIQRLAWAEAERAAGRPTIPSTLAQEKAFNPFVRANNAEELGRIRAAKDAF